MELAYIHFFEIIFPDVKEHLPVISNGFGHLHSYDEFCVIETLQFIVVSNPFEIKLKVIEHYKHIRNDKRCIPYAKKYIHS